MVLRKPDAQILGCRPGVLEAAGLARVLGDLREELGALLEN